MPEWNATIGVLHVLIVNSDKMRPKLYSQEYSHGSFRAAAAGQLAGHTAKGMLKILAPGSDAAAWMLSFANVVTL